MSYFEQLSIDGLNEDAPLPPPARGSGRSRAEQINDYEGFVEKFKPKKTTDDCYTPPAIYQVIYDYVDEFITPLKNKKVERPFYPGGDYQAAANHYDADTIVIDNPPFSILSKIVQFYQSRGIQYFLFAPHLTAFSSNAAAQTTIIADAPIEYENGAIVKTSFVSNMLGSMAIKGCPILRDRITAAQRKAEAMPVYSYPEHVITASSIAYLISAGISVEIDHEQVAFTRTLDQQKEKGKAIFGAGFITTDACARDLAHKKQQAEKIKAQKTKKQIKKYQWHLSDRERTLIKELSTRADTVSETT